MAKKTFTVKDRTFSHKQDINNGEQWKCTYDHNTHTTEAWKYINKKNPTRKEIVSAFDEQEWQSFNEQENN